MRYDYIRQYDVEVGVREFTIRHWAGYRTNALFGNRISKSNMCKSISELVPNANQNMLLIDLKSPIHNTTAI